MTEYLLVSLYPWLDKHSRAFSLLYNSIISNATGSTKKGVVSGNDPSQFETQVAHIQMRPCNMLEYMSSSFGYVFDK